MSAPTPQPEPTEAEPLRRAKNADKEAFYALVQPRERSLFAAAMAILNNPADAEDAVQEAVLKAFSHLSGFRAESKFSTWLTQITLNEARLKLRKDRRHLYDSLDEPQSGDEGEYSPKDFADWREIPSESLQREELKQALNRAVASLPPKYREVLLLRDVQSLSTSETAQILGLTPANVKIRLLRARLQMRDALAPGIDGSWSSGKSEYQKVRPW